MKTNTVLKDWLLSSVLILVIVFGILYLMPTATANADESDFDFQVTDGSYGLGAYVTGYSAGKDVIVPYSLNGSPVVSVVLNSCSLDSLDVSDATSLKRLSCRYNNLSELNISNNAALTSLVCNENQLIKLDVRNNTALTDLNCNTNRLTTLSIGNNTAITKLNCSYNEISTLDLRQLTNLSVFECGSNRLISLDLSNNKVLTQLYCSVNSLTKLDVSNNTLLTHLFCYYNRLTSLDIDNNIVLTDLGCSYNYITDNVWLNLMISRFEESYIIPQRTVEVRKKVISNASISYIPNQVYSGKFLTPAFTVRYDNVLLKNGTDYTVKYYDNKNIGEARAIISGIGDYFDIKAVYFNINPKANKIIKLTKAKKALTVKWGKISGVTGYQVQYRVKGTSKWKSKTIKGTKKSSATIKSLKAKKKYQVRVRTYKTVYGKKYNSAWSKIKSVKTK